MTKALENLINKYGADELHKMIDREVFQKQDRKLLQEVLESDATAVKWFTNWATQHGLELENPHYGGKCYQVKGWKSSEPYVYLWLTQGKYGTVNPAHFELGSSLSDLWWAHGLNDLTNKLDQILKMRVEETA